MFKKLFGAKPEYKDLNALDSEYGKLFKIFQDTYELETIQIEGRELKFYDTKGEKPPLLIIPGSTGRADAWFLYLMELREHYRVVIVEVHEMEYVEVYCKLLAGLQEEILGIPAEVMGHAFGSALAQWYADLYPEQVSRLILLGGFANTGAVTKKTRSGYERSVFRLIKALEDIKFSGMQKTLYKQVIKGVDVAFVDDKPYWKAFYGNIMLDTSQRMLEYLNKLQLDFWKHVQKDRPDYAGDVVLIDAKTELDYKREEKNALFKRYETAARVTVNGSGNMFQVREIESIIKEMR